MLTTRIRIAVATMATALTVTVATGSVASTAAYAAAPHHVKVGSSGNKALDDICRQMGDVINNEIAEGGEAELSGDYGGANAWWNQASDHIARSQALGCVMSIKVPRPINTHVVVSSGVKILGGGPATPDSGSTARRKKITGTATKGKGNFDQNSCSSFAYFTNYALDQADNAALAGDAGGAAGWRQYANELLAAGRQGGCTWSAALRAGQTKVAVASGTLVR